ncbi:MAG: type II secretion system GspH family protein [Patescibacteria group bacterium]|nr:type II secretion system GspH family protein [Patescibacteria group bacterium]
MHQTKGFTLIELLVTIAIIGLLASIIVVSLNTSRNSAKVAQAASNQKQFMLALQLYFDDVGFYPPDVNRGWDPGFSHALPYNPDTNQTDTPACDHCPSDWVSQVQSNWRGPYIVIFPNTTPWNGKYDYNYWPAGASRYGCNVPPGIYFGVQADYADENPLPPEAEQRMIDLGLDHDGCLNGEAEMLMIKL